MKHTKNQSRTDVHINKPLPASPCQQTPPSLPLSGEEKGRLPLTRGTKGVGGFTLVELIVTITIIAILGVIAFTAFKGFESSARDSTRSSDLANLSQALDTSYIKTGSYPNPDNAFTVTYSGGSLWYQGTVGDTLINILSSNGSKLSKKPTDPLTTTKEYAYSKSAYGNTYELSSNWEGDSLAFNLPHPNPLHQWRGNGILSLLHEWRRAGDEVLIPTVYASSGNPLITYIKGNYNGMVAKTVTGSVVYVIATPSITTSTGTVGSTIDVTTLSGKLLYHGQTNSGGIAYTPTLIYSSGALPTNDTASGITNFTNALKTAYSGSVISYNSNIQNLLSTTGATNITSLGASIITNYLGGSASAPPPPPATSYSLSNSLLFDSANSQYLSRTPTTTTTTKGTFSAWIKLGALAASPNNGTFIGAADNYHYGQFWNNTLYFSNTTYYINTAALFRDFSSWYHVVFVYDTTLPTASDRLQIWVNGVRQTPGSMTNYPPQNASFTFLNSNQEYDIGRRQAGQYFDGYLADVNFIESGALDPTAFGYADPTTNQWLPKQYAGSYGTNGFHLDFSDTGALTTVSNVGLGKDSSGNGNYWVTNNLALTNSVIDTPLNNFATLNPLDIAPSFILKAGNLKNVAPVNIDKGAKGTIWPSSGKWYYEYTLVHGNQFSMMGWADSSQSNTAVMPTGVGIKTYVYYPFDQKRYNNSVGTAYGSSHSAGDVVMVAYDADNGKIWWGCQGAWFSSGNPATGINPAYSGISGPLAPWILEYNQVGSINFGQGGQSGLTNYPDAGGYFKYSPPSGFKALSTANLPPPAIVNPKQYFDVLTYTGNSTLGRGVTGLGFQPDFVWIKNRTSAIDNVFFDSVRGAGKQIESPNLAIESDQGIYGLTSFNSNGFTLGSNGSVNSANTYVAWNWKKGDGISGPGFDIVSYTGSTTVKTIPHNLGTTPLLIMVKNRTNASPPNWAVYHKNTSVTPQNVGLNLNTTASLSTSPVWWNNTLPTSTGFTVGTGAPAVNNSGDNFIAYLFSEVPGFSKFGSYTGNGNADGVGTASTGDGPFIYTGFRPKYILIKNTGSSTSQWISVDSIRDSCNPSIHDLFPSANYTESSSTNWTVDILSNGFKIRGLDYQINGNTQTHIYAAFAEAPFKYANAR